MPASQIMKKTLCPNISNRYACDSQKAYQKGMNDIERSAHRPDHQSTEQEFLVHRISIILTVAVTMVQNTSTT
jgi:hypothetical protein